MKKLMMITMLLLITAFTVSAQIIQWQGKRPIWGLEKEHIVRTMEHPVNLLIVGYDAQGKQIYKEKIIEGNTNINIPFKVAWRTDDIDPNLKDEAQFILGDIIDLDTELLDGLVPKPIWEIWILSEAPTTWDKQAPEPPTPDIPEATNNINEMTYEQLLELDKVGSSLARKIIANRPFVDEMDLRRVTTRRYAKIIAEQVVFE